VYNSVVSRFTNQPDSVHEFLLRLRNATRRKLWKIGGKRVDNPPPVVVVSPGGAGSSLLLEELEKYLVVNSPTDRDGLKHIPRRPRNVSQCILLTGTPVSVVRSPKTPRLPRCSRRKNGKSPGRCRPYLDPGEVAFPRNKASATRLRKVGLANFSC